MGSRPIRSIGHHNTMPSNMLQGPLDKLAGRTPPMERPSSELAG
jgi:hypothetical protein